MERDLRSLSPVRGVQNLHSFRLHFLRFIYL